MKAGTLRDVVGFVHNLVDEVKVECDDDNLIIRAVDNAHVAMAVLEISKEAFIKSKWTKGENLCLDLAKLSDILKLVTPDTEFKMEKKDGRLLIKAGNLTRRMALLDEANIQAPGTIPTLVLPASITISSDQLLMALRAAEQVSDTVSFIASKDAFRIKTDTDSDEVEANFPSNELSSYNPDKKGDTKSKFSLDYLMLLFKGIPQPVMLEMEFGNSYPLRVKFHFASGNADTTFLIAPRIEE